MFRASDTRRRARVIGVLAAWLSLLGVSQALAAPALVQDPSPHGRFKEACADCHDANGWKPARISARFDHGKRSGFALEGAHAGGDCRSCHRTLEFTQSNLMCASCHADPHRGEMGTDCARCHGSRSFVDRGPMLRAHQLTRLPLTGSHAGLDCEGCHRPAAQGQMQFVNTSLACSGCHMPQFQAAKAPDHVASGFPTTCVNCHTTLTWNNATFDHDRTAFPLTGAHRATACTQCHTSGRFVKLATDCASCHQHTYDTAQPPHPAAGFPAAACAGCHTTAHWSGAVFDHQATAFPLTGAHVQVACISCHGDQVYKGKPTACQSCHLDQYNSATPNHVAAHFLPSNCATCHNTQAWTGAIFDHDTSWFPIDSGAHKNQWTACSDCHTVATDFAQFTCLSCHPHSDKTQTDGHHSGVRNYSYASPACYSCHPSGRAG